MAIKPPEDPLVGVARQIGVVAEIKKNFPDIILVGAGYFKLRHRRRIEFDNVPYSVNLETG